MLSCASCFICRWRVMQMLSQAEQPTYALQYQGTFFFFGMVKTSKTKRTTTKNRFVPIFCYERKLITPPPLHPFPARPPHFHSGNSFVVRFYCVQDVMARTPTAFQLDGFEPGKRVRVTVSAGGEEREAHFTTPSNKLQWKIAT